ncbi:ribonuclease activity regulator RraA [Breoghania sp. L-A4]|uniref:ribonuclease activity regulator RraA n=1 Tax=Breoghania sp. L-A4 TaxID=2304600 RepID=UPI000E35974C|nr:ribonuclease activity regulator RraA [Breoghania sp. L-A4]AXS42771.1 ribonuclease activity regulator RraA [Breoghania sp. L-A4]
MSPETREKLSHVSCATLTTALFKRGLRNVFLQDVHPITPKGRNMVGPAFTLRYIPAREDLNTIAVFESREHPQRVAIETCPEGHVLVMDSRQDPSAASAGDILVTRLMVRGAAGIVSDGGFRDSPKIGGLDMPAYHNRPAVPTNLVKHQAIEINCAIGCAGVAVFPGDIIVGDDEGVVVIPAGIADEIATEAAAMTLFENFVSERVMDGQSILGLYPPTDPANREAFDAWLKARGA